MKNIFICIFFPLCKQWTKKKLCPKSQNRTCKKWVNSEEKCLISSCSSFSLLYKRKHYRCDAYGSHKIPKPGCSPEIHHPSDLVLHKILKECLLREMVLLGVLFSFHPNYWYRLKWSWGYCTRISTSTALFLKLPDF